MFYELNVPIWNSYEFWKAKSVHYKVSGRAEILRSHLPPLKLLKSVPVKNTGETTGNLPQFLLRSNGRDQFPLTLPILLCFAL